MRRIRLVVSYDGTGYCGSQLQPNGVTVEEKLNEAISGLTGETVRAIGASRTDAGVHARGNVWVFDTAMRMAADKFSLALNQRLPADIRISRSDEVPLSWHPRKQNCVKTYTYRILNRKTADPLLRLYSHFCYYDLDLEKMKEAARCLIGEHDFRSFCTVRTQAENTVRTIYTLSLSKTGDLITMTISGSGFLYNMVRIIAGTLLKIGMGIWPPEEMQKILRARDRQAAGPCAEAAGLTLESIEFETALKPLLSAENESWSYVLDQRETKKSGRTFLVIRRCAEEDYRDLLTRELHQAWRNGASEILAADLEKPERLKTGEVFGFYTLEKTYSEERMLDGVNIKQWYGTSNTKFPAETPENTKK